MVIRIPKEKGKRVIKKALSPLIEEKAPSYTPVSSEEESCFICGVKGKSLRKVSGKEYCSKCYIDSKYCSVCNHYVARSHDTSHRSMQLTIFEGRKELCVRCRQKFSKEDLLTVHDSKICHGCWESYKYSVPRN